MSKSNVYIHYVSYSTKAPRGRGRYVLKMIEQLSCKSPILRYKNPLDNSQSCGATKRQHKGLKSICIGLVFQKAIDIRGL